MKFINRKKELAFLEERWGSGSAEFIVIYGKRRTGKTELVKHFIKDKPAVYFLSDGRNETEQLKELGKAVGKFFSDPIPSERGFRDWIEAFTYLKQKNAGRMALVIDEFPYLAGVNKAVSSLFQKGWDEYLKDTRVFLILLGSSISMMESEVLLYKSPLYGRRTGQILFKPFPFKEAGHFFPGKRFDEFLSIFSITGGIPSYLLQIDPSLDLLSNIEKKIFPPTEFLHNEVEFILKEELREPRNYLAILRAISWGKCKFGEIVNDTGLQKNILTKYLSILEKLQIIEREIPVTEKTPAKSRKGLYKISDNFFRFWFQYVFPYKSDLELGRYAEVRSKINESFRALEALTYEKVCLELVWDMRDKLFPFERAGRWWDKEKEIDVVAFSQKTNEILFGEAKWSKKQVGTDIYLGLKEKAPAVDWGNADRKERFILFSKSGFTKEMIDLAKKEKVFLVHQDLLER